MPEIGYVRGDATVPSVKGAEVIAHVCNHLGGPGSMRAVDMRGITATVHDHGEGGR